MKRLSANPLVMRDINAGNVLSLVREKKQVSQTEVATILGVQASTVSRIMRALAKQGLVQQAGEVAPGPSGGRRAQLWQLKANGAYSIGVDIGFDDTCLVATAFDGSIITQTTVSTPTDKTPASIKDEIVRLVLELRINIGIKAGRLLGVGISFPGLVNAEQGMVEGSRDYHSWKNVPLADPLSQALSAPVFLENDLYAMALGEQWIGSAKGAKSFLCVHIRRGIGLSVVLNNQIYKGPHSAAARLAHLIVEPNGSQCPCGKRGCLRVMASEQAILDRLALPGIDGREKLLQAVQDEHPTVLGEMKNAARYLGLALSHAVELFDPECIVMGGQLVSETAIYFKTVYDEYRQFCSSNAFAPIHRSSLGESAIAVGAASIPVGLAFAPYNYFTEAYRA